MCGVGAGAGLSTDAVTADGAGDRTAGCPCCAAVLASADTLVPLCERVAAAGWRPCVLAAIPSARPEESGAPCAEGIADGGGVELGSAPVAAALAAAAPLDRGGVL